MKRTSFQKMNCSIARALEVVGEWWALLIVRDAFTGVRRFDDFQRNLGVARNVLAARLKRLVKQGVLERHRYSESPPRFEYRLTEKGLDLYPVIVSLLAWGDRWACGAKGPPVVLCDRETGMPIDVQLVDHGTGRRLDPRTTIVKAGLGATAEQRRRFEAREKSRRS